MKWFSVLLAVCLVLIWTLPALGSEPANERFHLQIEPMYIGVWGCRENVSDLGKIPRNVTVDPNNDLRLRGEISYRRGDWRVGFNGWYFDSDYEVVNAYGSPLVSYVGQTKVSFWSMGPFIDYKIFDRGNKELFVQVGVKANQSRQRLFGFQYAPGISYVSTVSYADIHSMYGPSLGIKGKIDISKRFSLQGFITQTVSFGDVNRQVIVGSRVVSHSARDSVTIPITELYLKGSYFFTRNLGVGLGGLLSIWYDLPSPPRPTASGRWHNPEHTLIFTGLIFAVEGKW